VYPTNYRQKLSEREATVIYNMGLRKAIHILERAEDLSPEGRRHLVDVLKKEIEESEVAATMRALGAISEDLIQGDYND